MQETSGIDHILKKLKNALVLTEAEGNVNYMLKPLIAEVIDYVSLSGTIIDKEDKPGVQMASDIRDENGNYMGRFYCFVPENIPGKVLGNVFRELADWEDAKLTATPISWDNFD